MFIDKLTAFSEITAGYDHAKSELVGAELFYMPVAIHDNENNSCKARREY